MEVAEGGEQIVGMLLEPSLSCHSLFSLHGEDLLRMEVMETPTGGMVATHHHHQGVAHHALLHQAICLHGVLRQPLDQGIIHQVSQWVVHLLPHHQEEKVHQAQAAAEHHQVGGACLHGELRLHHRLVEPLLLALFHHHQVEEVLLHLCRTGIRVEVEDGVVAKQTLSQTYSAPLLHPHPLANLEDESEHYAVIKLNLVVKFDKYRKFCGALHCAETVLLNFGGIIRYVCTDLAVSF